MLVAAATTACLVQMCLPPDFPPPVKAASPIQLDLALEQATMKPAELNFSQQDVNAYLASRLTGKKKVLNKPFLDFGRAAVVFKEGGCVIGWERSFFGYPLYGQSSFQVSLNDGKLA